MMVCGFCRDKEWSSRRHVPRHGGIACIDCGVMYAPDNWNDGWKVGDERWYLERYLSEENGWDRWKMIPDGCMVVVDKWSEVE